MRHDRYFDHFKDLLRSQTVGGDIWEGSAAAVEERLVVRQCCIVDTVAEVVGDGRCLVGGLGKVIAKATRAGIPCYFGANGLCATNCGNKWAGAGKLGCKLRSSLAIVRLAWRTDACDNL